MPYDTLIKNGVVVDGTGAPPRHADVAVAAGKIAEIGKFSDSATRVIDAADCVVPPGFVDTFLDLTLEDDLDIEFVVDQFNTMVARLQELLVDPQLMIALGDGGAHVDMLCDCGYPT